MRRAFVVLGVLVLTACQDQGPGHRNMPISSSVGSNQVDNPFFQWQSPVPPGEPAGTGDFYATLDPVVTICQNGSTCTGINWSADNSAPAPSAVAVANTTTERYEINWSNVNSHDRGYYTISVTVLGKLVGEVTIQLTSTGGSGLDFSGNTVPIRFRIEVGALCYGEVGCAEQLIGPGGGVIILDPEDETTGTGGLNVPAGAVNDFVVFHMNRYHGPQPCLPFDASNATLDGQPLPAGVSYIQYEACYTLRTVPEIGTFAEAVAVGMCLDQWADNPVDRLDQLIAVKGKEIALTPTDTVVDPTTLVTMPAAPDDGWMSCLDPTEIAMLYEGGDRMDRLASRAERLLAPLGRLLSPKPAYAKKRRGSTGPFTRLAAEFSRAAPVRPVTISYANVDQTGLENQLLQPKPAVIVESAVPGVVHKGVVGVPVQLVPSGASTVAASPIFTGLDGWARADWTLAGAGSYTLNATVGYFGLNLPNSYGGFPNVNAPLATKQFTAVASTYHAYFMSPLGDGSSSNGNLTTVATRVYVCGPLSGVGGGCTGAGSSEVRLDDPKLDRSGDFWQSAWKPNKNVAAGLYRIEVRLTDGARIGYHYGRRGSGGGTDEVGIRQFNNESNVPIKYTIGQ
jgi:hypothetical protein